MNCQDICKQLKNAMPEFPILDRPWKVLETMKNPYACNLIHRPDLGPEVYAAPDVEVQAYCLFNGKVILDSGVRIGPYTFMRGPIYVGHNSKIGPHCEIIRSIIMNNTILAHKNSIAESIFCDNINFSGLATCCNISMGKSTIKISYEDNDVFPYEGKYGVFINSDVVCGALTITMPGCYIPSGSVIIGQCIVYGNGKIKSMVVPNI